MLKLSKSWPVRAYSSLFLCPFNMSSLFFEHFLAFWYKKMLQVHFVLNLLIHEISHFSEKILSLFTRFRSWICSSLWQWYCFYVLSVDRATHIHTESFTSIFVSLWIYRWKKPMSSHLYLQLQSSIISFSLVFFIFIFVTSFIANDIFRYHYP